MTKRLTKCEKAQRAHRRALMRERLAFAAWERARKASKKAEAALVLAQNEHAEERRRYFAANPPMSLREVIEQSWHFSAAETA